MYEYFSSKWYKFKILFTSATESNRQWNIDEELKKYKFEYKILEWKQLNTWKKDKAYFHINSNFRDILDKEQPDILIHAGWAWMSVIQSKQRCKKNNNKFILWSWSTKYEKSWRRTITKPFVKYVVKGCDGYRSYWTRASEYLVSLWAEKEKIYPLYNSVDSNFFSEQAKLLEPQKEELKKKYWITTKHILLFVWQLIERKGIYEILEWFKNFQKENKNWSLVFLGWWQEKEKMEWIIEKEWIKNVYFPGFFQKDKICEWYAVADIFTLPSREEVWWLVINEAMYFWLPIITAYQVWACVDLVKEWENWYIMRGNTDKEFERCMNEILENKLIENNSSKEIISNFSVDKIVSWINF